MRPDARSTRRRQGIALLSLELLEDRHLLSGSNPALLSQSGVNSADSTSAHPAGMTTTPSSGSGNSGANGQSSSPSDPTPDDSSEYSGTTTTPKYGDSNYAPVYYSPYGQQNAASNSMTDVAPILPAVSRQYAQPAPGTEQTDNSSPTMGSPLSADRGTMDSVEPIRLQKDSLSNGELFPPRSWRSQEEIANRVEREPAPADIWSMSLLDWLAPEEAASDGLVEDQPVTESTLKNGDPTVQGHQLNDLLGGALPVDLTTLNRTVDEFFGRLEGQAVDLGASPETGRLTPWIVLAMTATGAFEFARRRLGSSAKSSDDWDPHLSTLLTLFPPEDAS